MYFDSINKYSVTELICTGKSFTRCGDANTTSNRKPDPKGVLVLPPLPEGFPDLKSNK